MPSTKLYIQHPLDADRSCKLVGILERADANLSTHGKPLALILHGSMGHKDYLFQRKLAPLLPMDSFRFDFRGNLESGGDWSLASLPKDVEDIQVVVEYMKREYGYTTTVLIGHSRGSIVTCKWIASGSRETQDVEAFVNVSGRYRMERFRYIQEVHAESIQKRGYGIWKVRVAGKPVEVKIYPADIDEFANWDTSYIPSSFPPHIDVLSIQGMSDGIVPPYDAVCYALAFEQRKGGEGRHTLHFIEDADHNFAGHHDEVNQTIVEWLTRRARKEPLSLGGLWRSRL